MGIGVVGTGITVPGIPVGAIHAGPTTLGCPGSLVALDGLDGPGFLAPGLDPVADAAKEILGIVTRRPTPGVLTVLGLNGAFSYTGGPDYALVALWVGGMPVLADIGYGPGTSYLQLGLATATWGGQLVAAGGQHAGAWASQPSAWGGELAAPGGRHAGGWSAGSAPTSLQAGRRVVAMPDRTRLRRSVAVYPS